MPIEPIPEKTDAAARAIVNACLRIHRALGPGLLESIYEECLCHELNKNGFAFKRQVNFPVIYDGTRLDAGLRIDLLVEDRVIVELKAVEKVLPLHQAQLMTYLKITGIRLGMLINFNVPLIKQGIKRIAL